MKLKKAFAEFYEEIKIGDESEPLIEKRKKLQHDITEKLPNELEENGIELKKTEIEMFDQGSYKYNTTIKADIIDRDVAVLIPLDICVNDDPRKIKSYLRNILDEVSKRTVTIKEPCVTVSYYKNDEEWMHIDLPLYAKHDGNTYLARGSEYSDTFSWEEADPVGLNKDLCSKINGNAQLRRVIRYIKKWKIEKYSNSISKNEVPPSIGLTYLACDCFEERSTESEGDNDLEALYFTMKNISERFNVTKDSNGEIIEASIEYELPVKPNSDIFQKMKNSKKHTIKFYNRLSEAVNSLNNALNAKSEHDAGNFVVEVFGEEFVPPQKEARTAATVTSREHNFGRK